MKLADGCAALKLEGEEIGELPSRWGRESLNTAPRAKTNRDSEDECGMSKKARG
jgi:hypothetical protein